MQLSSHWRSSGWMLGVLAFCGTLLAFAVSAVVATAVVPPQGYANEKKVGTAPIPILFNGKIQLHSSVLGETKCQNTFYGQGWNESGHGLGEVLAWSTAECTAPVHIRELEESEPNKAAIERWIKEHNEAIAEPKAPIKCAAPETKAGEVKCITVYATAERPIERESGQGEICKEKPFEEGKTLTFCKEHAETETKQVIKTIRRRTASVPWKSELVRCERTIEEEVHNSACTKVGVHTFGESGTAVEENTACFPKEAGKAANFKAVPEGCVLVSIVFPQIPLEFVFYGAQEVWGSNGSKNGLFPSSLEFLEPAGELFSSEELEGKGKTTSVEGTTATPITAIGASHVELLTSKCEKEPNKFEEC
jgi:hypothetical protein